MQLRTKLLLVLASVALTVGLDQWTKQLAIAHLQGAPEEYYLGGLLRLTYTQNTGAFLSLGSDLGPIWRMIMLNVMPALLVVGLLWYIFREKKLRALMVIGLSLIVGGGLSNIIDRIAYGYVVDMLHLKAGGLQTGIFNVADMAIMGGMFVMIYFAIFVPDSFEEESDDDEEVLEPEVPTSTTTTPVSDRAE